MIDSERKKFWFDKLEYKPHGPEQREVHNNKARFRILCCGRRWGKTTFGANEMTAALLDPTEGNYFWIVGPNYVQGEKEFRIVYNNIFKKLRLGSKVKSQYNVPQGLMRIETPWGSVLEVKSAERQKSLLGEGLTGVIMAEAAEHDPSTWTEYVRPALSDKRGWAIFSTTPEGFNWFYGLWMMGQLPGEYPDYKSWRMPSWTNRIVYPGGREDEEIQSMEAEMSEMEFSQEIAAEFTSFTGKIYDEFDPAVHVRQLEYNPRWANYWSFDYGFSNPFVCLDIMVDPSDNVYVWREYYVRHKSTGEHGDILKNRQNPEGFHVDAMFGDPRGADEAATLALILGPVWGRDVPWSVGINEVKRAMKLRDGKPRLFIHPRCEKTIWELQQLRQPDEKHGINSKEGQHKHNDHTADALRYFFSEYFVLGAGRHLEDLYGMPRGSEAETFFQQEGNFRL